MRLLPVVFKLLVFLSLSLVLAFLAMMPQSALALTASQVYERVQDSVVVVKAYDRLGKMVGLGSGVVLPSGDIVTNHHVVKSGVQYQVSQKGKAVPATVKAGDPKKDLCILTTGYRFILEDQTGKPDKDLCLLSSELSARPARLGQASRLKVGEKVFAVGAPQGLELSLSEGIVSQLRGGPPPIIQTTVAISQGSSGGGLFNAEGELVGITTFYLKEGQGLNFAVPVEWVGQVVVKKPQVLRGSIPELPYQLAQRYNVQEMKEAAIKYADHYGIPRDMFLAYIGVASNWDPLAKDPKRSACGLGKITDSVGRKLGLKITGGPDDERWDPGKNMDAIARLFAQRYEKYGNWKQALLSIGEPSEEYYNRVKNRAIQEESFLIMRERTPVVPTPSAGTIDDWEKKALVLENEGDWQGLLAHSRQWTRVEHHNHLAWSNLGFAYFSLRRGGEAIEAYRESLRLKPDEARSWFRLGLSYELLGRYQEAIQTYREATRLEPDRSSYWYSLACAYSLSGNRRAALEAIKELQRLNPSLADMLINKIIRP